MSKDSKEVRTSSDIKVGGHVVSFLDEEDRKSYMLANRNSLGNVREFLSTLTTDQKQSQIDSCTRTAIHFIKILAPQFKSQHFDNSFTLDSMINDTKKFSFLYALTQYQTDDPYDITRKILDSQQSVHTTSSLEKVVMFGRGMLGMLGMGASTVKGPRNDEKSLPGGWEALAKRKIDESVSDFMKTHQLSVPEKQLRNAIQQLIWLKEQKGDDSSQSPSPNFNF